MKKGEPGPFFDPSPGVFENKTWMKLRFFSPSVLKSWFQTLQTLYVRLVPSRVCRRMKWDIPTSCPASKPSGSGRHPAYFAFLLGGQSWGSYPQAPSWSWMTMVTMTTGDSHVRTPPDFPSCWGIVGEKSGWTPEKVGLVENAKRWESLATIPQE